MLSHKPWQRPHLLTLCLACLGILVLLAVGPWTVAAIRSLGWRSYHDSALQFQVSVPPAWHTMSLSDWHTMTRFPGEPDDYCDERGVAILPPDLHGTREMGQYHPRAIVVGTEDNCTMLDLTHDPNWSAEPNQVMVGGVPATLYVRHMSSVQFKAATVAFGQQQFIFTLTTFDTDSKADTAIFLKVLQGFKYTGS